jgi:hypothetical protein
MEAVRYSETLLPIYKTTRCHIPEVRDLKNYFPSTREDIPLSYLSAVEWEAVVSHTEVREEGGYRTTPGCP